MTTTSNLNIAQFKPLLSPRQVLEQIPLTENLSEVVVRGRASIQSILRGEEKRLMVVVGPCSIHDPEATLDYASRLRELQVAAGASVLVVMRAYFEKPRTTLGWKGLLYDPHLDESDDIQEGILLSRRLLLEISRLGLPAATEILDPIVPQYLCDMVSWASIGARTAESQIHRQMASGLSMPIGFKNSTDGNLSVAIDAIRSAASPHAFLGIDSEGRAALVTTRGNPFGHLVMRGGASGPNYASEYVAFAEVRLRKAGIPNGIVVDCSHANSGKDHRRQHLVLEDVLAQIQAGSQIIRGIMLESFLEEGNQPLPSPPVGLRYGVSITDQCLGWEETEQLVLWLARSLDRLA
jgi:3-deoxy-7-phosphoheptulonate synthase